MATTTPDQIGPAGGGNDDTCKEDAAVLLHAVLGEEFVAAMHEGFLKGGDFTGVREVAGGGALGEGDSRCSLARTPSRPLPPPHARR